MDSGKSVIINNNVLFFNLEKTKQNKQTQTWQPEKVMDMLSLVNQTMYTAFIRILMECDIQWVLSSTVVRDFFFTEHNKK